MLQYNSNLSRVMEQETILKNGRNSKSLMSRANYKMKNTMKRGILLIILFLSTIVSFSCASRKSHAITDVQENQMIGVWRSTSERNGERIKVITKNRFVWTFSVNNVVVSSASGTYTFDGENYIENIEYGTQDQKRWFGKKAVVKVRIKGKNMDYSGLLDGVLPLNETWERIE